MSRRFARGWKLDLCRRIVGGELSRTKACRDHGLSAAMLERWLKQFAVYGENSFQGQPWRSAVLSAQDRIEQLEEELRLAKLEVSLVRRMLDEKKSPLENGPK